jgi:dTDP-4-amino-4,6-dideoxygalactose transaminase
VPSSVERLEHEFASQYGFAGGVAAGFGRAALLLALEAAEVRGGEVLLPEFVCAQVPEAIRRAGGEPVFYPVAGDLSVEPEAFRAAFTPATRAAVAVHYFGRSLNSIAKLAKICGEHRVKFVEDCALSLGVPGVGTCGDFAVFSFTKSDWCHGGGLVASRSPELIARARAIRNETFHPAPGLAFGYGLLRRADFAANRPGRSRAAEFAGRTLERIFGLRERGFFDAGRFDSLLPGFAARRALRLIEELPETVARRRRIANAIRDSLGPARRLLYWPDDSEADTGSFLLIRSESGEAFAWRERAARVGVALRLCWPAYQDAEPAQAGATLSWLAEHFLLMEIHSKLTEWEVQRIVRCLKNFVA